MTDIPTVRIAVPICDMPGEVIPPDGIPVRHVETGLLDVLVDYCLKTYVDPTVIDDALVCRIIERSLRGGHFDGEIFRAKIADLLLDDGVGEVEIVLVEGHGDPRFSRYAALSVR